MHITDVAGVGPHALDVGRDLALLGRDIDRPLRDPRAVRTELGPAFITSGAPCFATPAGAASRSGRGFAVHASVSAAKQSAIVRVSTNADIGRQAITASPRRSRLHSLPFHVAVALVRCAVATYDAARGQPA